MNLIHLNVIEKLPEHLFFLQNHAKMVFRLPENGVYLQYDAQGLSLCKVGQKGRVWVDFVGGSVHHRRTQGGGELIAKAVNHTSKPIVWDATGGLGRDSFVLASLGLTVRVFEQNLAVYALLYDGWQRAMLSPDTRDIAQKMTLIHGNASHILPTQATEQGLPDVVYLDPMYPERQKSAAVKKEMAYFHDLVGLSVADEDATLLRTARQIAKKRVIVKRPRLGENLGGEKPAYQYVGKSTRFDVYLPFQAA